MANFTAKFDDIRLIVCVQGYQLNYQYIVREIGFWSRSISGVIPFNCKVNKSHLDQLSAKNIHIAVNEIHGIKQKKNVDNALPSSDVCAVLKCLFQITKRDSYDSGYIGVCKEENVTSLFFKAGLGNYLYELDNLDLFQSVTTNNSTNHSKIKSSFPTLADIKFIISSDPKKYSYCELHDRLRNNEFPVCARTKAEIISTYIQQLLSSNNGAHNIGTSLTHQQQVQQQQCDKTFNQMIQNFPAM